MRYAYCATVGSRGYGLATETSDTDVRGFYMPSIEELVLNAPEQFQHKTDEQDIVIYDVRKFYKMAKKGSSLILECLYADEAFVAYAPEIAEWFVVNRQRFVTPVLFHSYIGAAINEFHKYLGTQKSKHLASAIRLLASLQHAYTYGDVLCSIKVINNYELIKEVKHGGLIEEGEDLYSQMIDDLNVCKNAKDYGMVAKDVIDDSDFNALLESYYKNKCKGNAEFYA